MPQKLAQESTWAQWLGLKPLLQLALGQELTATLRDYEARVVALWAHHRPALALRVCRREAADRRVLAGRRTAPPPNQTLRQQQHVLH